MTPQPIPDAEHEARRWARASLVQLERLQGTRKRMVGTSAGVDRETCKPFFDSRTEQHFLVLALEHLRKNLSRLGRRDLRKQLPTARRLNAARDAFEHPESAGPRYSKRHGGDFQAHSWSDLDGGAISDLALDHELEAALLRIDDALWHDVG